MNFIFEKMSIISYVDFRSFDSLNQSLDQNGFRIFQLQGVKDAPSLFAEIKRKLPLDPGLSGKIHWDAFADSLTGGLFELGNKRVAILWLGTNHMAERVPTDFQIAVSCFAQVAKNVANPTSGEVDRVLLLLFLIGEGVSFRPFMAEEK